jgi:translation initiation factor IF-3
VKPPYRGKRPDRDQGLRVNHRIRIPQVRVIDPDGNQLGVMDTKEALDIAKNKFDLDLIEVSPFAKPPVCKIMDFGKYKFELKKKNQEAKKKQTIIVVKEIKMRPTTDTHDFDVKMKHVMRFLDEGNKVKISIRFRGREVVHADLGRNLMDKVAEQVKDVAVVETSAKLEGKNMSMILAPAGKSSSSS